MRKQYKAREQGAALIMALVLLSVFALLGTWFVDYMSLEVLDANEDLRQARARILAEAGVRAAAIELKEALAEDTLDEVELRNSLRLPTFEMTYLGGTDRQLMEREGSIATVTYVIEDENAKLNLNHAPVSVIARVLGLPSSDVRKIPASLPHSGNEGAWLSHLDDLNTRGLLDDEDFANLPRQFVTVSTVLDHDNPEPYINLDAAPEEVVDAVSSSLLMADAITSTSNTFRIYCEGRYESDGDTAIDRVEVLVRFDKDGSYRILDWRAEGVELPPEPVEEIENTDPA